MNKSVSPGGNTNEAAGTCFVFLRLRELIAVIVDFSMKQTVLIGETSNNVKTRFTTYKNTSNDTVLFHESFFRMRFCMNQVGYIN